jgi:hypothetical protein
MPENIGSLCLITIDRFNLIAKSIPKRQLLLIWKTLTSQPFPKVKAFQLEDEDFEHVLRLRNCRDDKRREMKEWGRILSTGGTDACVFNAGESADVDYVILFRANPYHDPQVILRHELRHIARGDL